MSNYSPQITNHLFRYVSYFYFLWLLLIKMIPLSKTAIHGSFFLHLTLTFFNLICPFPSNHFFQHYFSTLLLLFFVAAADQDDPVFKDSNPFSFLGIFRLSHIFRRRGDDKSVKTH